MEFLIKRNGWITMAVKGGRGEMYTSVEEEAETSMTGVEPKICQSSEDTTRDNRL